MAKRVQVVLNQTVNKLGRIGDLVEVAPGYAHNYLIPQGLAARTSPGILRQMARRRELEEQRLREEKQAAEALKATLEKAGAFTIAKQVGEEDAIFGTVTDRELAELIQVTLGTEIDRRHITLPDIKKLGTYQAEIKLHAEVSTVVDVQVVAN